MNTLLLDRLAWDILLDINGDIAVASEPYSLAQDAASVIKTFLGEVYFDTTIGIPYLEEVLARNPPVALLKARLAAAAKTVPDVAAAECFLSAITGRMISGQVQVVAQSTGQASSADFVVVNPQGEG